MFKQILTSRVRFFALLGLPLAFFASAYTFAHAADDATVKQPIVRSGESATATAAPTLSSELEQMLALALNSSRVSTPGSGINLQGVNYYSTQFPFADLMKASRNVWTANGSNAPAVATDSNGWPMSIPAGSQNISLILISNAKMAPSPTYLPAGSDDRLLGVLTTGTYKVSWSGAGTDSFELQRLGEATAA